MLRHEWTFSALICLAAIVPASACSEAEPSTPFASSGPSETGAENPTSDSGSDTSDSGSDTGDSEPGCSDDDDCGAGETCSNEGVCEPAEAEPCDAYTKCDEGICDESGSCLPALSLGYCPDPGPQLEPLPLPPEIVALQPYSSLVVDIDDDGDDEVIFSTANDGLHVLRDGLVVQSPSVNNLEIFTAIKHANGSVDLVVSSFNDATARLLVGDGSGNFVDGEALPTEVSTHPSTAWSYDFEGDGDEDLVIFTKNLTFNALPIQAWTNEDGTFVEIPIPQVSLRTATLGQLDDDVEVEFVVFGNDGNHRLDYQGGAWVEQAIALDAIVPRFLAIADLRGDARPELVGLLHTNAILGVTLVSLWPGSAEAFPSEAGTHAIHSPAYDSSLLADLDGDGRRSLILYKEWPDFATYELDFEGVPCKRPIGIDGQRWALAGDFDGDGRDELLTEPDTQVTTLALFGLP